MMNQGSTNRRLLSLLVGLVAGTLLLSGGATWADTPTCTAGADVCYYDLSVGAGNSNQVPPIAGHNAVNITEPDAAQLAGCDVLFAQNSSNGGYAFEWTSNLANIEAAISAGMVLVFHDRRVTEAASHIPGLGATACVRDFSDDADIDVVTGGTLVTSGPGGVVNDTTLDGGNSSSHGYCTGATLPAGGLNILSRSVSTESVTFSYPHGGGAVVYSTIPLDFYFSVKSPAGFHAIYAPNVVQYGVDLAMPTDTDGDGICDGGDEIYLSPSSVQFILYGGVIQLYPQNVYNVPPLAAPIAQFGPTFLPPSLNLDALDVVSPTRLLFSVKANGVVFHAGGVIFLQEDEVYELDLLTGVITAEPYWAGLGINLNTLDAIDKLEGAYAFSPGGITFVPGVGLVRPQNVYQITTGGAISVLLDGVGLRLPNVDCVDVLPDGRIAFSTSADGFIFATSGAIHLRDENAYIFDQSDGSIIESFDGVGIGLDNLDGCTLIIPEAPADE